MNHYAWCQVYVGVMIKWDGGKRVGSMVHRVTIEGRGTRETRHMKLLVDIDQITTSGELKGGLTVKVVLDCIGSPSHCEVNPAYQTFYANPGITFHQTYDAYSEVKNSAGKDKVGYAVYQPILSGSGLTAYGQYQTFRCDSATYVGPYKLACIFSDVPGVLHYSLSDPDVNSVAKHINDAYLHPSKTVPKKAHKMVPDYITRLRPKSAQIEANHRAAVKVCTKYWPGYAKHGKDCDEFPFKSTYEGASKAAGHYSARALNKHDNRSAGGKYSSWLTTDHILADDIFGVQIDK